MKKYPDVEVKIFRGGENVGESVIWKEFSLFHRELIFQVSILK